MKRLLFILSFASLTIVTNAQTPKWLWAKSASGKVSEYANSVAADALGNSYMIGQFDDTLYFGTTSLISTVNGNLFIAKYNPEGNVLWAKSISGIYGNSITIDTNYNLYITGSFAGSTVVLGSSTLINTDPTGNNEDMFIAKFDSNGNVLWAKSAGSLNYDDSYGVKTDTKGNVLITGYFSGPSIIFGNDTFYNNNTDTTSDIFIAKYNSNGNLLWAKTAGGKSVDWSAGIATDSFGDVYISGTFDSDTLSFDSIKLYGGGDFIAKYDSSGNVLWAKRVYKSCNGCGSGSNYGIATDVDNKVYITGSFACSIAFGIDTLNASYIDVYIAKYDALGNVLWAKRAGGIDDDAGTGITTDSDKNIYITGNYTSPTINFDSIVLTNDSAGYNDIFVAKYDTSGKVLWAVRAGGYNDDLCRGGIAIDRNKNLYISGMYWNSPIIFGSDTLNNDGYYDAFIAKLGFDTITGIKEINNKAGNIAVYPNPTTGNITIESLQKSTIEIIDIQGQTILQQTAQQGKTDIDISGLAKGVYILRLCSNDKTAVARIVKE